MRRAARLGLVVFPVLGFAALAWADGQNLQYYPKDSTIEEIKDDMRSIQKSLGVSDCAYCHQIKPKRDFGADTDMKKIARGMLKMRDKIQKELMTKDALGMTEGDAPKATCYMCHKAKEKPEYKPEKNDVEKEKKFQEAVKADKYKKIKAGMEKLVEKLNGKDYFTKEALGITKGEVPKATCWMCHRGEVEFSTKLKDGDGDK